MKLVPTFATVALLAVSSSAFAVPVPIATVGGADTLVHWASLSNSSEASERAFIAGYLGVSADSLITTYSQLTEEESGGESGVWDTVIEDASLYAFNFGDVTPLYFLIKTGNGVGLPELAGTFTHFLYENVNALNYGVIDLGQFTRNQRSGRNRHGQSRLHVGNDDERAGAGHAGTSRPRFGRSRAGPPPQAERLRFFTFERGAANFRCPLFFDYVGRRTDAWVTTSFVLNMFGSTRATRFTRISSSWAAPMAQLWSRRPTTSVPQPRSRCHSYLARHQRSAPDSR